MKRSVAGDVVILRPRGSFYGDRETDELMQAILDEGAAGNVRLVLDLSECQALNSIAIGVLMRGYASTRGRGGEIKLCGLSKRLKDLFAVTKLNRVFDQQDTEAQALAAFAAAATPARPAARARGGATEA